MGLEKAASACQGLGKLLVFLNVGYLLMLPLLGVTVPEWEYYFTGVASPIVICVTILLATIGISVGLFLYRRAREVVGL
jgi:hypothetical protein